MSTRYPTALPAVPEHRWHPSHAAHGGDIDDGTAWSRIVIDAESATDAELRVLAYVDHVFLDDLRGAEATAEPTASAERWSVRISYARPR